MMRIKIIYYFCTVILSILVFTSITAAETESTGDVKSVYELQVVYPIPMNYVSDFGIGMQGKYYQSPSFYLGWYTPVRSVFPFEKKQLANSTETIDYDIQARLMGTFGYTADKKFFTYDASILAGWRYWYTKTTVQDPVHHINTSYENSTTIFEVGLMSTFRWKLGKTLQLKTLNNLNCDFYAFIPVTDDIFNSEQDGELALGFSYIF